VLVNADILCRCVVAVSKTRSTSSCVDLEFLDVYSGACAADRAQPLDNRVPAIPARAGARRKACAVMRRYGAVLVEHEPELTAPGRLAIGPRDLFRTPFLGLTTAILLLALGIGSTQYGFQSRRSRPANLGPGIAGRDRTWLGGAALSRHHAVFLDQEPRPITCRHWRPSPVAPPLVRREPPRC
jgi:hypothetical protein